MSKHSWPRRHRYAAFIERQKIKLGSLLRFLTPVKAKRVAAHAARPRRDRKALLIGACALTLLALISLLVPSSKPSAVFIARDASTHKHLSVRNDRYGVPEKLPAPTAPALKISAGVSDWPMWRNNAEKSGNSSSNAILHRFSVNSLRQRWRQNLGDVVTSSAVLAGNSVFIGSHDGSLYALQSRTGAVKWRYTTGGSIDSSPAIVDGKVLFTSSDGGLYAVDGVTGQLVWTRNSRYSASSPLVSEGAKPTDTRIYVGSASGELHAYDLDGNLLWVYPTGGAIESSPAIATIQGQETVFVGSNDSYVYALATATHQPLWRFQTRGSVTATPATDGAHVYVGSRDGRMYALDARNGAPIWTYNTNGPITSSAAVSDADFTENSRVYVGSQSGQITAIQSTTGSVAWTTVFKAPIVSSPALAADMLYVGAGNSIVGLSSLTGNKLWSATTSGAINSSPSISDEILVFGSADNYVYAFSLSLGAAGSEVPNPIHDDITGNPTLPVSPNPTDFNAPTPAPITPTPTISLPGT
ncbi:PQQ-binding-like beta-propeller repeat protein [Streptomyces sp. 1222.5]|uniref:beta-alanine-activating enzyme beta-propeller domain-containing protein n=1 Tax=Streptomyces sp. 1222.5 TaxID=1881026 RepID=UPI003D71710E